MALITGEQWAARYAKRNMNVWFRGEKVEDTSKFPPLGNSYRAIKKVFDLGNDPDAKVLFAHHSDFINEEVSFYASPLMSQDDAIKKTRIARANGEILGCCAHRCTGSEALAALYPTTFEIDRARGTKYHENFKKFIERVQREDLSCTATLTDPKGDRSKRPGEQENNDMYVRVKEKKEDGIIIEGCKVNQTGIIFADEVVIVPTVAFRPGEEEYCVSCAIPVDAPGVTYVLGRTPHDTRFFEGEAGMVDLGKKYSDHQAMAIFEDVFVPWERVFLCGEVEFSGQMLEYFTSIHRLTAGGCKSGGLTMLLGATALCCEQMGIDRAGHVKDKLAEFAIITEALYGLSLATGYEGFQHASGVWLPNQQLGHATKFLATLMWTDPVRLARELFSGWGESAPAIQDVESPEIGAKVSRYLAAKPGVTPKERLSAMRLVEHFARGSNWTAMALHGGGNTEASRMMAFRHTDWNYLKLMGKVGCGIIEDDRELLQNVGQRLGKVDILSKELKLKK